MTISLRQATWVLILLLIAPYGYGQAPLAPTIRYSTGLAQSSNGAASLLFGTYGFGDSNLTGFAVQGGGNNFFTQFCVDAGIPTNLCVNNGLQSNTCSDTAIKVAQTVTTTATTNPLYVEDCGSNESDTGTANTANQDLGMVQTGVFKGSYLTALPSEEVLAFGSATLTGGYATDASTFAKSKGVSTATTGTATETVQVGQSGVVYCWTYNYTTSSGVYQMLDTTTPSNTALTDTITNTSTFNSQGIARAPVNLGTTYPVALRFVLTPNTTHTIQQNVTVSGPTGFIGCTSPGAAKHGQGAPTLVMGNTPPEQYGNYAAAVLQTLNNQQKIWKILDGDGLNVIPWDLYDDMNQSTDFDSKTVIGTTLNTVGSGQTNGTYTEQATTDTCGGTTHAYVTYTIAGGVITGAPVPTIIPGTLNSYSQNCTAASWTVAHGGTPGTFTAILSTNTGYTSAPPFHFSQNGHNSAARSLEGAVQGSLLPVSGGVSGSIGTQTQNVRAHYTVINATTPTFTLVASNQGGTCMDVANNSGSQTITMAGSTGNAGTTNIPPNGGMRACDWDGSGLWSITGAYNPQWAAKNVANTWTANQTIGVAGTSTGSLTLASATATGSVTLTPASAASAFTATLPAATDTVVELTQTQTLTNKSLVLTEINSGLTAGGVVGATSTSATCMSTFSASGLIKMAAASSTCPSASSITDDATKVTITDSGGLVLAPASTAGMYSLKQGTTQATGTTAITHQAPTAVTSYIVTEPGAISANNNMVKSYAATSGTVTTESFVQGQRKSMLTTAYTNATTTASTIWSFSVDASTSYTITCKGLYKAATGGVFSLTVTGPASPTLVTYDYGPAINLAANAPTFADYNGTGAAYPTGVDTTAVTAAATDLPFSISFGFTNGVTAGTFAIQGSTLVTNTLTVEAGSFCVAY